jgi:hypothetical protein
MMPLNVDELLTAVERALRARQKYPTERGKDQVGVSRVGGQGQEMGEVGSIEYAESFLEYFEGQSEHEALFIPEATAANAVVALMRTQPLTREAIEVAPDGRYRPHRPLQRHWVVRFPKRRSGVAQPEWVPRARSA